MQADRFRQLLDHDGPFASIYYDDSHDTADAATQLELRWRTILRQLEDLGSGRSGRALVADHDGIIVDEPLLRYAPPR